MTNGTLGRHLPWLLVGLLGAGAFAAVATAGGEPVGAPWIVVAAVCTYLIAYRYYSLFIAERVMRLDPARPTPAVRRNDGLGFVSPRAKPDGASCRTSSAYAASRIASTSAARRR